VPLKELRGAAGAEPRPDLDGTEPSAFFRARRGIRFGFRATSDEPTRRTRCNHERADQREEHAAILPGESSIQPRYCTRGTEALTAITVRSRG